MNAKDMKDFKINIKAKRGNLLACLYGDLSEDAAQIAVEEFEKKDLDSRMAVRMKEFPKDIPSTELGARVIQIIIDECSNEQELIYLLFSVGLVIGANSKSPIQQYFDQVFKNK